MMNSLMNIITIYQNLTNLYIYDFEILQNTCIPTSMWKG